MNTDCIVYIEMEIRSLEREIAETEASIKSRQRDIDCYNTEYSTSAKNLCNTAADLIQLDERLLGCRRAKSFLKFILEISNEDEEA